MLRFDLTLFLTVTSSRNPDAIETTDGAIVLPLNPANTVNVADLVIWDTTNLTLRTPITQADMTYYAGVAEQQNPTQSLNDTAKSLQIRRLGIVLFYTTPGETYTQFQTVYFNETLSVQTITNGTNTGARTVAVGYIIPSGAQIVAGAYGSGWSVSGAAGVLITVWLTPKYPTLSGV